MPTLSQDARQRYEEWHRGLGVDVATNTPWHQLLKTSLRQGSALAGQRVLEIGCGRGGLALWLADQQPAPGLVVAADFAGAALRQGQSAAAGRRRARLVWVTSDIERIPHPGQTFDLVISCETIEHVPHPPAAVRELARVLRPGGVLLLTTPNYLGPLGLYRVYSRLRGRRFAEEGQPINHCLLLPRTCAWVRRAGFRILDVAAAGYYFLWPRRAPRDWPALGHPRWLMRWFGQHAFIRAVKPPPG